jgi:8-oxo-dGTP pyrophosphatase MutT (NUDIX family)
MAGLKKSTPLSEIVIHQYLQKLSIEGKMVNPSPDLDLRVNEGYRLAAVLIPLVNASGEWHLLFTRRTETLPDHKGQVAFPGGAYEPGDENLITTALREAQEEIGINPADVKILGQMDPLVSVSAYQITPFVGTIPWPYRVTPSPAEVSRVFTIPLLWLAEPGNHEEREFFHPRIAGRQNVIYFKPYDGEVLWGISARLTLDLLKTLELVK